jgi:hypothetical protein
LFGGQLGVEALYALTLGAACLAYGDAVAPAARLHLVAAPGRERQSEPLPSTRARGRWRSPGAVATAPGFRRERHAGPRGRGRRARYL